MKKLLVFYICLLLGLHPFTYSQDMEMGVEADVNIEVATDVEINLDVDADMETEAGMELGEKASMADKGKKFYYHPLSAFRFEAMRRATTNFYKTQYPVKHFRSASSNILSSYFLDQVDILLGAEDPENRSEEYLPSLLDLETHAGILMYYSLAFVAEKTVAQLVNLKNSPSSKIQQFIGATSYRLSHLGLASILAFELVYLLEHLKNDFSLRGLDRYASLETRGDVLTGVTGWFGAGLTLKYASQSMPLAKHYLSAVINGHLPAKTVQTTVAVADTAKKASKFTPKGILKLVAEGFLLWTLADVYIDKIKPVVKGQIADYRHGEFVNSIKSTFNYTKNFSEVPADVGLNNIVKICDILDKKRNQLLEDNFAEIQPNLIELTNTKIKMQALDLFHKLDVDTKMSLIKSNDLNSVEFNFWRENFQEEELQSVIEFIQDYDISYLHERHKYYNEQIKKLTIIPINGKPMTSSVKKEVKRVEKQRDDEFRQISQGRLDVLFQQYKNEIVKLSSNIDAWEKTRDQVYGFNDDMEKKSHELFNIDPKKSYDKQIDVIENNFLNFANMDEPITVQHLSLMQQLLLSYGMERFGKGNPKIAEVLRERRNLLIHEYYVQVSSFDTDIKLLKEAKK